MNILIPIAVIGGAALLLRRSEPTIRVDHAPASALAGARPITLNLGPDAFATGTSIVNGVSIAQAGAMTGPLPYRSAIPSDLSDALDNDTALSMREWAALDPSGFQVFLNKYSDRLALRNDMYLERINNPALPDGGFQPTPAMLLKMGNAAYKVVQAINGVAVGRSVDIFGVAASAAGAIPGMDRNLIVSLQGAAMTYRAISTAADVTSLVAANPGVELMNLTTVAGAGAYPGLSALPLSGCLMAVGLCVDIGFTIIGDKPDLQKAIDVALDVISLAVLFIPVIGWIIALVIQIVKFVIDLFGDDLFGGGLSHGAREQLEAAKYGKNLSPMFSEMANAVTPREMFNVLRGWSSGYCGGFHSVAMIVDVKLKAGDTFNIAGAPYTVPADTSIKLGSRGCYWFKGTPWEAITDDEQAWLLGAYASVNGVIAKAQVGIAESMKDQFEIPIENLVKARSEPMRNFIVTHGFTLDQIDHVALEWRAQPHLNALAQSFAFPTWQDMLDDALTDEWAAYQSQIAHGSLTDFAQVNGYPTMYAYRAAALKSYEDLFSTVKSLTSAVHEKSTALEARIAQIQLSINQLSVSYP